jgi:hypothetical protein
MKIHGLFVFLLFITSCDNNNSDTDTQVTAINKQNLTSKWMRNEAAYIPSQCYTKTEDKNGSAHNPCYSCHVASKAPNYSDDSDLQLTYSFPEYANTNHWKNLFNEDKPNINSISDLAILDYVRENNYLDNKSGIKLAKKLTNIPKEWDFDADGQWSGFIPDCYYNFDEQGFDRNPQGQYTGWRTFAYTPFLGTFWPTNGSTDDVLIRLGKPFRSHEDGTESIEIYKTNLAIVEAIIKRKDITINPVDEALYNVDLNKNGIIDTAKMIHYDWPPQDNRTMSFVGQAKQQLAQGKLHLAAGLFPETTEFLHSVRYIDVDENGKTKMAARMKELRYAKKSAWRTYSELKLAHDHEIKEENDFPDRLEQFFGDIESGLSNREGWIYQGFIEDAKGELRPQTYEETVFCMGCHSNLGATTDNIFSFSRKLSARGAYHRGWYHWTQKDLKNTPEPLRSDGKTEYTYYLKNNRAGDEFRENNEIINRFFDQFGTLISDEIEKSHRDITHLIFPSKNRALMLDKAYRHIVEEQSFIDGRDTIITPPHNLHHSVTDAQPSGVEIILTGP